MLRRPVRLTGYLACGRVERGGNARECSVPAATLCDVDTALTRRDLSLLGLSRHGPRARALRRRGTVPMHFNQDA